MALIATSSKTEALLLQVSHRPYELPSKSWAMTQTWSNLLFAHWPVPVADIRSLIPPQLTVDTFDGVAWVGVVPFAMNNVRFKYLPMLASNFCELNVRTYVSYKGKRGVFFFSLDASNPMAVEVARSAFRLSYFHSAMSIDSSKERVEYKSHRWDWRSDSVSFEAAYGPTGEVQFSSEGSIEEFLTERYCLFTINSGGRIMSCDVHHAQWPLQPAAAEFRTNTMLKLLPLNILKKEPLLHYSEKLETIEWLLESCP